MAEINTLEDIASINDTLGAPWVNEVAKKISDLEGTIATLNQRISQVQESLSQAFRVAQLAGLTVSYTGGSVKLPTGLIAAVPAGIITLPANSVNYIWIDSNGLIQSGTTRPDIGLEIARVVSQTSITEINNYPLFVINPNFPDLSTYATTDYVNEQQRFLGSATKNTAFPLTARDTYFPIPFESLTGSVWNTAGTFTAPQTANYVFKCQIRMFVNDFRTQAQRELSGKISLFVNGVEIGTALDQKDSALGDLIFSGENSLPVLIPANGTASIRAYVTSANSTRLNAGDIVIRENSSVAAWKVTI